MLANLNTGLYWYRLLMIGVFVGLLVRGVSAGEGVRCSPSVRLLPLMPELIPMISGRPYYCFSFLGI